jgi:lipopolysaccharide export system permease protein
MNVVTRHLAREIIVGTCTLMVAFLGLFAFFDFVNELEDIGRGGYGAVDALVYVALLMPGRVYELLPVVVLIGSLYALTTLARNSEITVMRASGMSTGRMLRTLAGIGSVFVVATLVFGEFIAPPAERAAQQWRLAATGAAMSNQLRSGLWVKDGDDFVNVSTVFPDGTIYGVLIYNFDDRRVLHSVTAAQSGRHNDVSGAWTLTGVTETSLLPGSVRLVQRESYEWVSHLTPEVLSVLMVSPDRMSLTALFAYVSHLRDNRQDTQRFEIALWKKLTYPLAVFVMLALALPFALVHDRMGAVSVKVFMGVMLGVGFHMLNGLFGNLGVINAWPPVLAALTPSVLFLLAATAMLVRVERR